jgi:hypothetical protein
MEIKRSWSFLFFATTVTVSFGCVTRIIEELYGGGMVMQNDDLLKLCSSLFCGSFYSKRDDETLKHQMSLLC